LLAKKNHTQWTTDMIFFDNAKICLTPNYYVQKMFSLNQGDVYFDNVVTKNANDTTLVASCVQDIESGDIILKLVNVGNDAKVMKIDLSGFKKIIPNAALTELSAAPDAENTFENPGNIIPVNSQLKINRKFEYRTKPMSLTVIRVKTK